MTWIGLIHRSKSPCHVMEFFPPSLTLPSSHSLHCPLSSPPLITLVPCCSAGSQTRTWSRCQSGTSTGSSRCGDSTGTRSCRWSRGKKNFLFITHSVSVFGACFELTHWYLECLSLSKTMTLILHQHDLAHDGNPASHRDKQLFLGSLSLCGHEDLSPLSQCRETRLGLQGIPAIAQHYHTCHHLYNSIFQFLCQAMRWVTPKWDKTES